MKTSIFNMTLTLPPMVEITEVGKGMPMHPPSYCNPCTLLVAACCG